MQCDSTQGALHADVTASRHAPADVGDVSAAVALEMTRDVVEIDVVFNLDLLEVDVE